jgi:hypothetical protein
LGYRSPGPASVRPTEHFSGLAFSGRTIRVPDRYLVKVVSLPAPLWPAHVRRRIEVSIMVSLAGRMGETLVLGPSSRFFDDVDDRKALELAEPLMVSPKPSSLPPTEARLLAIAENGGPSASDDETALRLAGLIGRDRGTSVRLRTIATERAGPHHALPPVDSPSV